MTGVECERENMQNSTNKPDPILIFPPPGELALVWAIAWLTLDIYYCLLCIEQ